METKGKAGVIIEEGQLAAAGGPGNIRVLVADDAPLNLFLLKTILDDRGFQHEMVENGRIAIEKLQSGHFDIILLDLQMPEMDGFEVATYVRRQMNSPIPIIALTAEVTETNVQQCKATGMNDCIAKPVDAGFLYARISDLIKGTAVEQDKYINLENLRSHTKKNPVLMEEMIVLCLEQIPLLLKSLEKSIGEKDWDSLHSAVHRLIPSFSMLGIAGDFKEMAKNIQKNTEAREHWAETEEWAEKISRVGLQVCKELEEELKSPGK